MQDPSREAQNADCSDRYSLGLTPVPLDRRTLPDQTRPHHPLVSNRRAELSGALHQEMSRLRSRSYDAEIAKSSILANLSHEFRTPLNAIIGFSELLLSEATGKLENEQHREYIDDIHQSAFRLLDMVNGLLETANVTNGLADLNRQNTDLIALFSQACDTLKPLADARDVKLELDADGSSCFVQMDEQRFSQAARQILSEAIRQARPGGTILVRINRSPAAASVVFSCLSYNNVATSASVNSTDAHFVSRTDKDGAGCRIDMDLTMAKTIAELHGGVFDVMSGSGTGGLQAQLYLPISSG